MRHVSFHKFLLNANDKDIAERIMDAATLATYAEYQEEGPYVPFSELPEQDRKRLRSDAEAVLRNYFIRLDSWRRD